MTSPCPDIVNMDDVRDAGEKARSQEPPRSGRVLAMCTTRSRPEALQGMLDSAARTSTLADIAVYTDDDQTELYSGVKGKYRRFSGPRMGPCKSLRTMAAALPGYAAYGAMTDDCTFETVGWDSWVLAKAAEFKGGIGAISPRTNEGYSDRMDFPWVTGRWVETVGFIPESLSTYHFSWDVALQLMGEATNIAFASESEFLIDHQGMVPDQSIKEPDFDNKSEPTTDYGLRVFYAFADGKETVRWIALEMRPVIEKLKAAIAEATSEHRIHIPG